MKHVFVLTAFVASCLTTRTAAVPPVHVDKLFFALRVCGAFSVDMYERLVICCEHTQ